MDWFGGCIINFYLVLLLFFLGIYGFCDVLEYGVKIIGVIVFMVDVGVDIG